MGLVMVPIIAILEQAAIAKVFLYIYILLPVDYYIFCVFFLHHSSISLVYGSKWWKNGLNTREKSCRNGFGTVKPGNFE